MKILHLLPGGVLMLAAATALAQPMGGPMMGGGMMNGGMMMENASPRRPYVMRNGLPAPYRSLRNPLPATSDNISAGKQLYLTQCAACHGNDGRGNGPAAAQLDPRPADLSTALRTPIASDAYLYWTIGEGGTPVGSAMPPFKNSLRADEAWKIILYLRHL